jgi:hypothetical protein
LESLSEREREPVGVFDCCDEAVGVLWVGDADAVTDILGDGVTPVMEWFSVGVLDDPKDAVVVPDIDPTTGEGVTDPDADSDSVTV